MRQTAFLAEYSVKSGDWMAAGQGHAGPETA
jgi:hypothetical protein